MEAENNEEKQGAGPLAAPPCSATFAEWCNIRGVWPRLTHEEIWHTAWNAAIKAAHDKAWSKRDLWDEGDGYSPTKVKSAEEIGSAIRTLMSPNAQAQQRATNDAPSREDATGALAAAHLFGVAAESGKVGGAELRLMAHQLGGEVQILNPAEVLRE